MKGAAPAELDAALHASIALRVPLLDAQRHLVLCPRADGARLAVVEPEGRRRQDHHQRQPRRGLAQAGRRVLLVDLDPQGNATMGSGSTSAALARTVYHVLLGLGELAGIRVRAERGGYDLVPANRELAGAEVELVELPSARDAPARRRSSACAADYDFILIDCPPSLSLLTVNGLAAAQRVLIPMQCEYYALEGLSDLVGTIKRVRANLNPRSRSTGCCARCTTRATRSSQQVSQQLEAALRRQGLPHRDAAQRAPRRGAELRRAGGGVGRGIEGRAGLPRARRRNARTRGGKQHDESQRTGPRPRRAARRRRASAPREALRDAAGRAHPARDATSRAPRWTSRRSPSSPPRSARRA